MKYLTRKFMLALGFSIISSSAIANNTNISCPSIASVKASWTLLDSITVNSNNFLVWTATQFVRDSEFHNWEVIVPVTPFSNSLDDAFKIGQGLVKEVNYSMFVNAQDGGDAYLCAYMTNGNTATITLIAPKDNHAGSLTRVRLDLLKWKK